MLSHGRRYLGGLRLGTTSAQVTNRIAIDLGVRPFAISAAQLLKTPRPVVDCWAPAGVQALKAEHTSRWRKPTSTLRPTHARRWRQDGYPLQWDKPHPLAGLLGEI